jgi:hypothetical protein
VSGLFNKYGPIENVLIVKAATAYDNPATGITYILIIDQAIYLGADVDHTFLCPNQLRYNGITVDDCPKHLAPKDKPSTHSIFSHEDQVHIPLRMAGTMSVFDMRTPTKEEIEIFKWVLLTSDQFWDSRSETFNEEEEKLEYLDRTLIRNNRDIMSLSRTLTFISDTFDDYLFLNRPVQVTTTG